MKRLIVIFVLIYLNVPARYCMLTNNIIEVNTLDVPSPYEFLWITTMSYCNVHYLIYNMFIGVGLPIQNQTYSNDDIAAFLLPDNIYDWPDETALESPYKLINFREASEIIESFVFEIKEFKNVTGTENKITGLNIWALIDDKMVNFMNKINILSNQVNQYINDLNIQKNNVSTVDPSTMKNLYLNIFDQMVDVMTENIIPYKNAFNFLEKYTSKNNQKINIKQEQKFKNNFNLREYTRTELAKEYELYIDALSIFYNTQWNDKKVSKSNFIMWYDLNSSKSIFDYTASKLLTYVIKLEEYIKETYKYNTKNIPKLTSKVQEYVSTNLYHIIGLIKSPLQKILKYKDLNKNEILLSLESNDETMVNGLSSANDKDSNIKRIKNVQLNWNDSNIQTLVWDIINKYNTSLCDNNVNHNTKLMNWVEQMSSDEQKTNVVKSSIYATIIVKNFENVVLCSNEENDSEKDKEKLIKNLIHVVDEKLNEIQTYSKYSAIDNGENVISDIWNYIKNENNNIFNILDWLNKNISRSNIPYWPNDMPCNEIYIKNLIQLASVSSDMIYDVTLTSMHKALDNNEIDNDEEESNALYILEDLERTKHTYKNVLQQIKNIIKINTMYIESNSLIDRNLKHKAMQELAKCIKYKIFAMTEIIIPTYRITEYYTQVIPEDTHDYSEVINNMHNIFYKYFGNKTNIEQRNGTALDLIKKNEHEILTIYNKLRYKHKKIKEKHRYLMVLKYNVINAKKMYRTIISQLKKITTVNNDLNLKNNEKEVKRKLITTVALIMEDFIRYDTYINWENQKTPLYDGKYKYSISGIDFESELITIDYMHIYNQKHLQRQSTKSRNEDTLPNYPNNENKKNFGVLHDSSIMSSQKTVDQGTGDNKNTLYMYSTMTHVDENKTPDHRGSDVGRTPYIINENSLDINKRLLGGKNATTSDTSTSSVDTSSGEHHTVKKIASSSYKSMVETSTIKSAEGGSDENKTPDHRGSDVGRTPYIINQYSLDINKRLLGGKNTTTADTSTSSVDTSSGEHHTVKKIASSSYKSMVATSTITSADGGSNENGYNDKDFESNVNTSKPVIDLKDVSNMLTDYVDNTITPDNNTRNNFSSISNKSHNTTVTSTAQITGVYGAPAQTYEKSIGVHKLFLTSNSSSTDTHIDSDENNSTEHRYGITVGKKLHNSSISASQKTVDQGTGDNKNTLYMYSTMTHVDENKTPDHRGSDVGRTPYIINENSLDKNKRLLGGKNATTSDTSTSSVDTSSGEHHTVKRIASTSYKSMVEMSTITSAEGGSDENKTPDHRGSDVGRIPYIINQYSLDINKRLLGGKNTTTADTSTSSVDTSSGEHHTVKRIASSSYKSMVETSTITSAEGGSEENKTPDHRGSDVGRTPYIINQYSLDINKRLLGGKNTTTADTSTTSVDTLSGEHHTVKRIASSSYKSMVATSTITSADGGSDENGYNDKDFESNVNTSKPVIDLKDVSNMLTDYVDNTITPDNNTRNNFSSISNKSHNTTVTSTAQITGVYGAPAQTYEKSIGVHKLFLTSNSSSTDTHIDSDENNSTEHRYEITVGKKLHNSSISASQKTVDQGTGDNKNTHYMYSTMTHVDENKTPDNRGSDVGRTPYIINQYSLDINKRLLGGKNATTSDTSTSSVDTSSGEHHTVKRIASTSYKSMVEMSTITSAEGGSDENKTPDHRGSDVGRIPYIINQYSLDINKRLLGGKNTTTADTSTSSVDTSSGEHHTVKRIASSSYKSMVETSTITSAEGGSEENKTPDHRGSDVGRTPYIINQYSLDINKRLLGGKNTTTADTSTTSVDTLSGEHHTVKKIASSSYKSMVATSTITSADGGSDENGYNDKDFESNVNTSKPVIDLKDVSNMLTDYVDNTITPDNNTRNNFSSISNKSHNTTVTSTAQITGVYGAPAQTYEKSIGVHKLFLTSNSSSTDTHIDSDENNSTEHRYGITVGKKLHNSSISASQKTVDQGTGDNKNTLYMYSTMTHVDENKTPDHRGSDVGRTPYIINENSLDINKRLLGGKNATTSDTSTSSVDTSSGEHHTVKKIASSSYKSMVETSTIKSAEGGSDENKTPDHRGSDVGRTPYIINQYSLDINKRLLGGKNTTTADTSTSSVDTSSGEHHTVKKIASSSYKSMVATSTITSADGGSDENGYNDKDFESNVNTSKPVIDLKDVSNMLTDYVDNTITPDNNTRNNFSSISNKSHNTTVTSTAQITGVYGAPAQTYEKSIGVHKLFLTSNSSSTDTHIDSDENNSTEHRYGITVGKKLHNSSISASQKTVDQGTGDNKNTLYMYSTMTHVDENKTPDHRGSDVGRTPYIINENSLDINKRLLGGKNATTSDTSTSSVDTSSGEHHTVKRIASTSYKSMVEMSTITSAEGGSDENKTPDHRGSDVGRIPYIINQYSLDINKRLLGGKNTTTADTSTSSVDTSSGEHHTVKRIASSSYKSMVETSTITSAEGGSEENKTPDHRGSDVGRTPYIINQYSLDINKRLLGGKNTTTADTSTTSVDTLSGEHHTVKRIASSSYKSMVATSTITSADGGSDENGYNDKDFESNVNTSKPVIDLKDVSNMLTDYVDNTITPDNNTRNNFSSISNKSHNTTVTSTAQITGVYGAPAQTYEKSIGVHKLFLTSNSSSTDTHIDSDENNSTEHRYGITVGKKLHNSSISASQKTVDQGTGDNKNTLYMYSTMTHVDENKTPDHRGSDVGRTPYIINENSLDINKRLLGGKNATTSDTSTSSVDTSSGEHHTVKKIASSSYKSMVETSTIKSAEGGSDENKTPDHRGSDVGRTPYIINQYSLDINKRPLGGKNTTTADTSTSSVDTSSGEHHTVKKIASSSYKSMVATSTITSADGGSDENGYNDKDFESNVNTSKPVIDLKDVSNMLTDYVDNTITPDNNTRNNFSSISNKSHNTTVTSTAQITGVYGAPAQTYEKSIGVHKLFLTSNSSSTDTHIDSDENNSTEHRYGITVGKKLHNSSISASQKTVDQGTGDNKNTLYMYSTMTHVDENKTPDHRGSDVGRTPYIINENSLDINKRLLGGKNATTSDTSTSSVDTSSGEHHTVKKIASSSYKSMVETSTIKSAEGGSDENKTPDHRGSDVGRTPYIINQYNLDINKRLLGGKNTTTADTSTSSVDTSSGEHHTVKKIASSSYKSMVATSTITSADGGSDENGYNDKDFESNVNTSKPVIDLKDVSNMLTDYVDNTITPDNNTRNNFSSISNKSHNTTVTSTAQITGVYGAPAQTYEKSIGVHKLFLTSNSSSTDTHIDSDENNSTEHRYGITVGKKLHNSSISASQKTVDQGTGDNKNTLYMYSTMTHVDENKTPDHRGSDVGRTPYIINENSLDINKRLLGGKNATTSDTSTSSVDTSSGEHHTVKKIASSSYKSMVETSTIKSAEGGSDENKTPDHRGSDVGRTPYIINQYSLDINKRLLGGKNTTTADTSTSSVDTSSGEHHTVKKIASSSYKSMVATSTITSADGGSDENGYNDKDFESNVNTSKPVIDLKDVSNMLTDYVDNTITPDNNTRNNFSSISNKSHNTTVTSTAQITGVYGAPAQTYEKSIGVHKLFLTSNSSSTDTHIDSDENNSTEHRYGITVGKKLHNSSISASQKTVDQGTGDNKNTLYMYSTMTHVDENKTPDHRGSDVGRTPYIINENSLDINKRLLGGKNATTSDTSTSSVDTSSGEHHTVKKIASSSYKSMVEMSTITSAEGGSDENKTPDHRGSDVGRIPYIINQYSLDINKRLLGGKNTTTADTSTSSVDTSSGEHHTVKRIASSSYKSMVETSTITSAEGGSEENKTPDHRGSDVGRTPYIINQYSLDINKRLLGGKNTTTADTSTSSVDTSSGEHHTVKKIASSSYKSMVATSTITSADGGSDENGYNDKDFESNVNTSKPVIDLKDVSNMLTDYVDNTITPDNNTRNNFSSISNKSHNTTVTSTAQITGVYGAPAQTYEKSIGVHKLFLTSNSSSTDTHIDSDENNSTEHRYGITVGKKLHNSSISASQKTVDQGTGDNKNTLYMYSTMTHVDENKTPDHRGSDVGRTPYIINENSLDINKRLLGGKNATTSDTSTSSVDTSSGEHHTVKKIASSSYKSMVETSTIKSAEGGSDENKTPDHRGSDVGRTPYIINQYSLDINKRLLGGKNTTSADTSTSSVDTSSGEHHTVKKIASSSYKSMVATSTITSADGGSDENGYNDKDFESNVNTSKPVIDLKDVSNMLTDYVDNTITPDNNTRNNFSSISNKSHNTTVTSTAQITGVYGAPAQTYEKSIGVHKLFLTSNSSSTDTHIDSDENNSTEHRYGITVGKKLHNSSISASQKTVDQGTGDNKNTLYMYSTMTHVDENKTPDHRGSDVGRTPYIINENSLDINKRLLGGKNVTTSDTSTSSVDTSSGEHHTVKKIASSSYKSMVETSTIKSAEGGSDENKTPDHRGSDVGRTPYIINQYSLDINKRLLGGKNTTTADTSTSSVDTSSGEHHTVIKIASSSYKSMVATSTITSADGGSDENGYNDKDFESNINTSKPVIDLKDVSNMLTDYVDNTITPDNNTRNNFSSISNKSHNTTVTSTAQITGVYGAPAQTYEKSIGVHKLFLTSNSSSTDTHIDSDENNSTEHRYGITVGKKLHNSSISASQKTVDQGTGDNKNTLYMYSTMTHVDENKTPDHRGSDVGRTPYIINENSLDINKRLLGGKNATTSDTSTSSVDTSSGEHHTVKKIASSSYKSMVETSTITSAEGGSDENKTPDHRGSDVGRTPYIINQYSLDINKRLLGGKNATTSDTSTSSVDTSSGEHHTVKRIASSSYKSMVETSTITSAEGGSDENKTPDHRGSDVGRTPYIINQYSLDINKRLLGGKNTTTADTSTSSVDTSSGEHHTVKRIASSSYKSMVATSTITSADGGSDENGYNDKDFESNVNTSKPVIDLKDVSNMLTDYVDNTITPDNNTRNNFSSISNKSHNTTVTSTAQITGVYGAPAQTYEKSIGVHKLFLTSNSSSTDTHIDSDENNSTEHRYGITVGKKLHNSSISASQKTVDQGTGDNKNTLYMYSTMTHVDENKTPDHRGSDVGRTPYIINENSLDINKRLLGGKNATTSDTSTSSVDTSSGEHHTVKKIASSSYKSMVETSTIKSAEGGSDENKTPDHRGSDVGRTPYIINQYSLDINKRLLGGKNTTTADTSTSSVDTSSEEHHTVKKIASSSYKSMVETSTIKSAEGGSDENKTPDHRGSDVGRTPYIINQYSLDINKRLLGGKNTTTADTSTSSVDTSSGEHHTVKRIASSSYKSMVATSTITSADGGSDENGYNDKDFESNVNTSKPVIDLKDVSNMLTDYVDNTITPDNNTRNNFSSISNKSHNTNVTSTAQITDV